MPDSVSGRAPFRYPLRRIASWQLIATGIIAVIGGLVWGWPGAISGLLGGLTNIAAGVAYAFEVGLANPGSAVRTVVTAFRDEGIRIVMIVTQLWLGLLRTTPLCGHFRLDLSVKNFISPARSRRSWP